MTFSPKIFKAYDVRGLSPGELDADVAFRIGQALVKFTKAQTVVAGRDMRETSPELFEAFSRGVMSQGADVVDVGLVTTPMFYFAVGDYDLHDAGAMITASHNPKQYNGIKMCFGDALPIGGNTGILDVRDLALAGPYPAKPAGQLVETDIREAYIEKLLDQLDVSKFRPMTVVADAGNGMAGVIIGEIFRRLKKLKFHGLFLDLDGNFPNHEANPLKEETLTALKKKVRAVKADLGIAFDGDGDRVGFVDEKGQAIRSDLIAALVAPIILKRHPGAPVIFIVNTSLAVPEEIERAGGRPIMGPVGHGLIKPLMRQEGAVFAGELSGHFFFSDFYNCESSDLLTLLILKLMSETGKSLSELVAPLRRYHHSGEINSEVADKEAVMRRIEQAYGHEATTVSKLDGLRMDFKDDNRPDDVWWFSVRASNTEPLLRLVVEAKRQEVMEEKREELLALIRA